MQQVQMNLESVEPSVGLGLLSFLVPMACHYIFAWTILCSNTISSLS